MSQGIDGQRTYFPKTMKTAIAVIANLGMMLLLLAFLHNFFAVDIHINHAKHEIGVQVIVNDLPHVSMANVLRYIGHFLYPESSPRA